MSYESSLLTRQDKTRQDKTRQDKTRQDKTRANCALLYSKDLVSSKMNCGKTQFLFSDFFCCVRARDGLMMSEKMDESK